MSDIKLIVGLGNPGSEYEHTRHNAGVDLLNMIADKFRITMSPTPKFFGISGRGSIGSADVRLLFPTTFMNLSGQAVGAISTFYKIKPEEILVIHDELDLPPGSMKVKLGGGHAGHNGLKSIISSLGNNANFYRLRVGVGHPGDRSQVVSYVLGRPVQADRDFIAQACDAALASIQAVVEKGPERGANLINGFKPNK